MKTCMIMITLVLLCMAVPVGQSRAQGDKTAETAQQITDLSGLRGGLAVHHDCGDGGLIFALGAVDSWVVQGLSRDAQQVERCRRAIESRKSTGNVTVRLWQEEFLPYSDNLVNLFVADSATMPPMSEVMRVLAPHGVACIKHSDGWRRTEKPWPNEIDEWTHWLHAADGNPVANDQLVSPPRSIQWIATPNRARSHDAPPSLMGMVSAHGRLFYVADTSPVAIGDPNYEFDSWHLCARDAFNGVMLWKLPLKDWGNRAWSPGKLPSDVRTPWAGQAYGGIGPWISNPYVIHKRLVARGNRVYATLGFHAPVTELDAATGEILRTFDSTAFADEIVVENDVLFVTVDRAAQRAKRYVETPEKSVLAIDLDSGRVLWERRGFHGVVDDKYRALKGTLTRLSLIAGGGKVFVGDKEEVVAIDAQTGEQSWQSAAETTMSEPRVAPRAWQVRIPFGDMLYSDGVVYTWQLAALTGHPTPIELMAFAAEDGSLLWKKDCGSGGFRSTFSVYKARGLVWAMGSPSVPGNRQESYELWGMDPRTGQVVENYNMDAVMKTTHHHRCYRNKATENHIIFSRNGLEFMDLETGKPNINRWVRGICGYGVMPANGLTYVPPQQCACFPNAHMPGLIAYGGTREPDRERLISDECRLWKGSAYGEKVTAPELAADDWPIYRHDGLRSAATPVVLAEEPSRIWESDLNEPVTAPTLGWGKVFLAGLRTHTVKALDAETGQPLWTFRVDNRVDTPPTLWQGKAYFGTAGGYVYCLRADDGALVWRFDSNPAHESIVVHGNVESPWPIHGSVVVNDGAVYFAAGRSSYVGGGLRIYALDAESGKPRHSATFDTADAESDRSGFESGRPSNQLLRGAANELLVHDGDNLYLKNLRLDAKHLSVHPTVWPYTQFTKQPPWEKDFGESPLVSTGGFLDDTFYDRTSYIIDQQHSARKIAFTDDLLVGLRWDEANSRMLLHNHFFQLGRDRYTIFARKRSAGKSKGDQPRARSAPDLWV
nr:PQQ-binding-like beta-propeller repeat protein [Planctomycetota bacterium]